MTRFILRAMPERTRFITAIKEQIPDLIIVWDKTRNAMDTFRSALETQGEAGAVHLEDDVVLTSDFRRKIEPHLGDSPAQFFSMTKKDDLAKGSRWRPGSSFMMGQCFYLPPGMAPELLDYSHNWPRLAEHPTGLDTMIADFLKSRRLSYWQHVPSLVQHAETKSLIDGRRSSKRQSPTFVE